MQCNATETPEHSQVQNLILRTEKNEIEPSMEIANTSLRGYITDPGVVENVAGPKKARWQVTVTSDDCALKKHFQGWQVCTKVQADDYHNDDQTSKETESSEESATTPFIAKLHAATSYDCQDSKNIEEDEEPGHGSILLKEYLKLLTNGDARINFIIGVLSQAIHKRKTFVICGSFPVLRKPLVKRGWLEKRTIRKMMSMAPQSNVGGLEHIERLLRHNVADFVWYTTKHSPAIRLENRTLINKFSGCYFTSKVDMCNNLENVYWFYESGISNIQFPRCYNIYQPSQVSDFKADYRITACLGMLKWFLSFAKTAGPEATWSENGNIPINAILFALERCTEFISVYAHEDIDREDYQEVSMVVWDEFLEWYYSIMQGDGVLRRNSKVKINELAVFAENILIAASKYRYLQGDLDGMRDVWILKPGDKSLGRGIVLMDRLPDILNKITQTAKEGMQYVVQKYIESPLLVYNKKIDIRQWFLITSTHPLVVWMYSDILIRFASRDFTLNDFHESIHLCNTMVQIKYRKKRQKDSKVPEELHWNLQDFKDYLKGLNQESAWDKIIRPGIRQNLIGALLASQNNMVNRKNSFQLYGADFVIMDDFSVWLIEINTNPRLHPPSSIVTSKLYPEVIEDTIKIVIDRRRNKKASYGKFTCIFKQKNPICGTNSLGQGTSLGIRGHSVFRTNKLVGNLRANTTPSLY
ncbi:tubulin glycylase 3A-like [Athalia rosae]|uniref:tubulin glycylase 3A-like n=1 Tax=Athalia rosae TaxID=37344 RepID=UPI0020341AE7|nr:tubulin glycylase 3A-like [Athalia rosae]